MINFFDATKDTVYIHLKGEIDKETYWKVLSTVLSVRDNNRAKDLPKQKVVVFINTKDNDVYARAIFRKLSTIQDQLYTVLTGHALDITLAIFLLADPGHRFMLRKTTFSFNPNRFNYLKTYLNVDEDEFEMLKEFVENNTCKNTEMVNLREIDNDLNTLFNKLGIKKVTGNILDAINE